MSQNSGSCLVAFIENFIDLSEEDKQLVSRLEKNEREFTPKSKVFSEGDEVQNLYVVRSGWACTKRYFYSGRRQILQFHVAGDLVAVPDIAFPTSSMDFETLTETKLCPFPRHHMHAIFSRSPHISAFFYSVALVERAVLLDRIAAVGRMDASARVAHFLLEIFSRLQVTTGCSEEDGIELPLTQDVIGDAIGLTNVYVSRTLSRLEQEGFIEKKGSTIVFRNPEGLRELCEFSNRWAELDMSWYREE